MSARHVPVYDLRSGDKVILDDGQEVTVRREPYKHWSGAVVVRVDYTSAEGPGRLERRPSDLVLAESAPGNGDAR